MQQFIHKGVLIPRKYEGRGFHILVKGRKIDLTPKQEEMAVAWVKKLGTEYVNDPVFVRNFFRDFRKTLNIKDKVPPEDFDFSEIKRYIDREREIKQNLSKEAKKKLAQERKAIRETNKEKYGYAFVDDLKVEVSNYTAEPSSIFMGRGKHPLRGRWKKGPDEKDIILNLSPDAPRPKGNWKEIVWQPNSMWVARWKDKLRNKKYKHVWLSDAFPLKQMKDISKFNKARELKTRINKVRNHITNNLSAKDVTRRKVATVCYLIDTLKLRVGDEKDRDETDTVGATTLRPNHINISPDGKVTFDFLGKDSVRWQKTISLPKLVVENLSEFMADANSTVFDGVKSKDANLFLSETMPGLTAKVFRTYHATKVVTGFLKKADADKDDSEARKKHVAKMANLQAAIVCNHKRKIPKSWQASLDRRKLRLKMRKVKGKEAEKKLEQKAKERVQKYEEKLKRYQNQLAEREKQGKSVEKLKERIKKLKMKHRERVKKFNEHVENRKQRDKAYIGKLKLQIKAQDATRDYSLATSLKSYVDPRIYYKWGRKVDFDWKLYYPKALQKKFSWVELNEDSPIAT
ncbi:DNA topoisomerase I [Candidatus Bathyarchaeota archaeon]|nr:MAG: DNA topoisomerase I [Candidatus Bathyarchaeota archaeon]